MVPMWNSWLFALLCSIFGPPEEIVTVPLSLEAKPVDGPSEFDVLFEYERKDQILVDGKEYTIIPPALPEGGRVGYGFIYFTGQPEGALEKQDLFVDANGNLDLRDDPPCVEKQEDGSRRVRLHPAGKPEQQFTVQLRSFRDRRAEAASVEPILQPYIQRMGGKAAKSKYWLSEQRLSTMAGDAKLGDIAFRIGVHDYDCNGSYADHGSDRILVGNAGVTVLSHHLSGGAATIEEETLIVFHGRVFEILEVDPAGGFLKLQPSTKPCNRLGPESALPALSLDLLTGEKRELTSYSEPDRFLLLDFWGCWCKPCLAAIPQMKEFQEEWKGRLTVLGLHYGDAEIARGIVEKQGIPWDQAVATKDLQERFLVDSWPFLVLVGPDGKILQMNTELREVASALRASKRGG
jgi:thiol-disulfide isomerase/thioredoxin